MKLLVLSLISIYALSYDMEGVLDAIAKVESQSYKMEDGSFVYVDQRTGKAGELGPYQMTRIAFNQVKLPGESFHKLSTDVWFARDMAERYINWLLNNSAKNDWTKAIQYYNGGPHRKRPAYLRLVLKEIK